MSPTMTEGGIASWKKAEGDTFTAGDVLLEIVTISFLCSCILQLNLYPQGNRQGYHRR